MEKTTSSDFLFLCNRQPGDHQTSMQQAGPINSAASISQIHGQSEREGSGLRAVICACANVTFSVDKAINLVHFGFSTATTSASSRPTVSTSLRIQAHRTKPQEKAPSRGKKDVSGRKRR